MIEPFAELLKAASLLTAFDRRWLIAGGWAIDLHLGRVTRPHKDVDIAIFRSDQLHLQRYLVGWQLYKAHGGELHLWREGEYVELPLHSICAYRPGRPSPSINPAPENQPDLEFVLNERTATHWLYRRDPAITLPLSEACLLSADGMPYLAPEIVLLYKSRNPQATDEADFQAVCDMLGAEQKVWLRQALEKAAPEHRWLEEL